MSGEVDPLEVARGLSESEAHLFKQFPSRFSIHPGDQSRQVRELLRKAERELACLTNPSFDNYYLTPLGIAVRRILSEDAHDHA